MKAIIKKVTIVLFIIVLLLLHGFSAIDEIKKSSPIWYVAVNIIIPALAIVAIALYGFNIRPARHRWIWKAVPVLYASLVLWDFISHISMIKIILSFQPFTIFWVILILSLNFIAVYFSLRFGFDTGKPESTPTLSHESKVVKGYAVITKILLVICILSVAINLWIILCGFYHAGINSKVPFVYTRFFTSAAVVFVMPWLFGFTICMVGLLVALSYRYHPKLIIPSFIILALSIASVAVFYFYQKFWVATQYY